MAGAGDGSRVDWAAPRSAGAFIPREELRGNSPGAEENRGDRAGCPAGRGGSGRGAAPRLSLPREAAGTAALLGAEEGEIRPCTAPRVAQRLWGDAPDPWKERRLFTGGSRFAFG